MAIFKHNEFLQNYGLDLFCQVLNQNFFTCTRVFGWEVKDFVVGIRRLVHETCENESKVLTNLNLKTIISP